MLYQSPGIYILLAAGLSSVSLLINNWINNKFQLERERQQRIWQEESDRQKWYREKIYEYYTTLIQILKKSIQAQSSNIHPEDSYESDPYIDNLYSEFTSEFALVIIGHPCKNTDEFKASVDEIIEVALKEPFFTRALITEMMEKDPRINAVNKGYLNSQKS